MFKVTSQLGVLTQDICFCELRSVQSALHYLELLLLQHHSVFLLI